MRVPCLPTASVDLYSPSWINKIKVDSDICEMFGDLSIVAAKGHGLPGYGDWLDQAFIRTRDVDALNVSVRSRSLRRIPINVNESALNLFIVGNNTIITRPGH